MTGECVWPPHEFMNGEPTEWGQCCEICGDEVCDAHADELDSLVVCRDCKT